MDVVVLRHIEGESENRLVESFVPQLLQVVPKLIDDLIDDLVVGCIFKMRHFAVSQEGKLSASSLFRNQSSRSCMKQIVSMISGSVGFWSLPFA
jgi:hypothetical protein